MLFINLESLNNKMLGIFNFLYHCFIFVFVFLVKLQHLFEEEDTFQGRIELLLT